MPAKRIGRPPTGRTKTKVSLTIESRLYETAKALPSGGWSRCCCLPASDRIQSTARFPDSTGPRLARLKSICRRMSRKSATGTCQFPAGSRGCSAGARSPDRSFRRIGSESGRGYGGSPASRSRISRDTRLRRTFSQRTARTRRSPRWGTPAGAILCFATTGAL